MISRRSAFIAALGLGASIPSLAEAVLRASTLLDDGPAAAVATRVMAEAYRRVGMELRVIKQPAERSLLSANSGDTDAELYRREGMERTYPNLIRIPVPIMTYEIVAFAPASTDLAVFGWPGLRPFRLGFVRGVKVIEDNTAGMNVTPVVSLQRAFAMLAVGRVDLVVANRLSGLAAAHAEPGLAVRVLQPPLASFPVFHYVHRQHQALVQPLTEALREMERSQWIQKAQEVDPRGL